MKKKTIKMYTVPQDNNIHYNMYPLVWLTLIKRHQHKQIRVGKTKGNMAYNENKPQHIVVLLRTDRQGLETVTQQ
jgi:hypothetical protein